MHDNTAQAIARIRLLVCDFDGVLTDNRVYVDQDGREMVACNRSDSLGIELLRREAGIETVVISKEKNAVVQARCDKMRISCCHGIDDKVPVLETLARERGIALSEIAYIGNDVNDLECMRRCGLGVAVADAHRLVLDEADVILRKNGGCGAVREFIDMLVERK
ncbi:MAG: HAD hydrolase family protein [Methanomicrobiales archaeon]|nr:HAD hydrolase family protein [Methanomicrobiales archaeon]